MLDESHDSPPVGMHDDNTYVFGSINSHNVVIACLPPDLPGIVSAQRLVQPLRQSFPNIKEHLFVGIGGGVPRKPTPQDPEQDIRLGDVVVGWPHKQGAPAVIQWDARRWDSRNKDGEEHVEMLRYLDNPSRRLLSALGVLEAKYLNRETRFSENLQRAREIPGFAYPGSDKDILFNSTYNHPGAVGTGSSNSSCEQCDKSQLEVRPPRTREDLVFHRGTILSGSGLFEDAQWRDELSKRFPEALCFEMEAAGVIEDTHCLVIRGICDYADTHKNWSWQGHAAAAAAAFGRELLYTLQPWANPEEGKHKLWETFFKG